MPAPLLFLTGTQDGRPGAIMTLDESVFTTSPAGYGPTAGFPGLQIDYSDIGKRRRSWIYCSRASLTGFLFTMPGLAVTLGFFPSPAYIYVGHHHDAGYHAN